MQKQDNSVSNLLIQSYLLNKSYRYEKLFDSENKVDINNIFLNNRLGFSDTFEAGRSLTLGLDFKENKNNLENINKYFELKLATVFRDEEEELIQKKLL